MAVGLNREKGQINLSGKIFTLILLVTFSAGSILGASIYMLRETDSPIIRNPFQTEQQEVSTKIAAIAAGGDGVLIDLHVKVEEGSGNVFYRLAPFAEVDIQYSADTAVKVSSRLSETDPNSIDVTIRIDAERTRLIGGPSAGAAMTIATYAALENKEIREDAVITGEIRKDGTIGFVGGILRKAEAVERSGRTKFLIPDGQAEITFYREVIVERGPFRYKTYEPYILNLNEHAENEGWNLEAFEVATIEEAIKLMVE